MQIPSRVLLIAAFAAIAAGCAAQKPPPRDPFTMPREQVLAKMRKIALTPIVLPKGIVNPDEVKKEFRGRIAWELKRGGLETIPEKEYESRWTKAATDAGGYYDPITGAYDERKANDVEHKVLRSLASELGAEGVLFARVVVVSAPFDASGRARWDGAVQVIQPGAGATAVAGFWTTGHVGALSLVVELMDMEGSTVFSNAGGVETTAIMSMGRILNVRTEKLLKTPERNAKAVDLALTPLTLGPPPAESPAR